MRRFKERIYGEYPEFLDRLGAGKLSSYARTRSSAFSFTGELSVMDVTSPFQIQIFVPVSFFLIDYYHIHTVCDNPTLFPRIKISKILDDKIFCTRVTVRARSRAFTRSMDFQRMFFRRYLPPVLLLLLLLKILDGLISLGVDE